MSQWKLQANTLGTPKWGARLINQGSGPTAIAANTVALLVNTTPGVWNDPTNNLGPKPIPAAFGIFAQTPFNYANGGGENKKVAGGPGWVFRRSWEGPVNGGITVANGANFTNGEMAFLSGNGSSNGQIQLLTNATGNLSSAVIVGGGGLFTNVGGLAVGFSREKHVSNVNVSGTISNVALTNSSIYTLTIANAASNLAISYSQNAYALVTSNSTGGLTNTVTEALVWTGNTTAGNNYWGIIANNQTNTALTFVLSNSSVASVNISGLTFSANLITSSGGAANVVNVTLGGRAGRVQYETLVSSRFIANGTSGSVANTTTLPQ